MKLSDIPAMTRLLQPRCSCGQTLNHEDIGYHPHPEGLHLEDLPQPVWLFYHCPRCGYDTSLAKIMSQNPALRTSALTEALIEVNANA